MFIINEIIRAPITRPNPAGINTPKLKLANELTYNSYNPNEDKITALSTPGIIEDPATATPSIIDCIKFGFSICGNAPLFSENNSNPAIADIPIKI